MPLSSTGNNASSIAKIESCLWLPESGEVDGNGWLLAKGWAYVVDGLQIAAAFEHTPSNYQLAGEFFSPMFFEGFQHGDSDGGRPTIRGFSLAIPMRHPGPDLTRTVLLFRYRQNLFVCAPDRIEDAADADRLSREHELDELGRNKLKNLLLNESERLRGSIRKASHPISLYIDPSFACNLHCPHCISEMVREQGFNRRVMRSDRVRQILDRYGATLIRATLAMWGEPLLNKRFAEIVGLLKQYDVFCETSTNLSLPLTDRAIEGIVGSGLDEMRLSIDGATQETYERYRVGGNLNQVLTNLRRLAETKRRLGTTTPRLRWQYLLFPWNRHEREAAERLAAEYGADEFYSFAADLWDRPPSVQPRTAGDDAMALGELGRRMADGIRRRADNHEPSGCGFLDHTLAIHSDGAIYPCCYYPAPKDALGSWEELQADPFNAPRLLQLRRFVRALGAGQQAPGPSPCAGCGSLTRGYVEDHLDFMKAFELLTAKPRTTDARHGGDLDGHG